MSIHVTKLFDEENGEIKTKPCQDGLRHLFQDKYPGWYNVYARIIAYFI